MTDEELKTFRRFLDQHMPEGTAHMSDADLAGLRQLMEMMGNPAAAANLIAEIDSQLAAGGPESDAQLCDGSLGARFDSPDQARSFLRQFRSRLMGEPAPSRTEMSEPAAGANHEDPAQTKAPRRRPPRSS
jgi:hypothetical protein